MPPTVGAVPIHATLRGKKPHTAPPRGQAANACLPNTGTLGSTATNRKQTMYRRHARPDLGPAPKAEFSHASEAPAPVRASGPVVQPVFISPPLATGAHENDQDDFTRDEHPSARRSPDRQRHRTRNRHQRG
jgi:hypothetical protein